MNIDTVENQDLRLAFDFVKYTNRNIFLTGKAGTGKTTFLHELKKILPKRMIVLAPTGVAAINAGGVTIHSFFQLPFHPFIPAFYLPGNKPNRSIAQDSFRMSREKTNIIRSLDLLVIDEISMVRADLLDAVDSALRRCRNDNLPFGGVQLLMIGDLQQLAPVAREDDMEILGKYYSKLFFFGSHALSCTDYVTIELKHIYRQNDQVFISLLNKIRENRIDQDVLDELNKRYTPDFDTGSDAGYITLTTHNHQAASINDSKLAKLPGTTHLFRAVVENEFPESSYPNVNELVLKKGAQVMFVKNDISGEKLFFNGKIGSIEAFDGDVIIVKCPGDDFNIRVEIAEWQNMKYTLDDDTKEIQETVIGTFRQYPLKLAWAITIHKSQGLTFERAVIDARSAFAHGQVYVALSRCRNLDGLVLSSRIDKRCIFDNRSVTEFINETQKNQPGQSLLAESRKAYQAKLLTELFDFTNLSRNINYCLKVVDEHGGSIGGNPGEKLKNALTVISELAEVSEKFKSQMDRLLSKETDIESNGFLQERLRKAGDFFSMKLEAATEEILSGFSLETDNKAVRKAFNEAHEKLKKESQLKLACLNYVKSGFKISEYLEVRAKSVIESPATRSHKARVEESSGEIRHPALRRQIKEWRYNKAGELNLPEYMILPRRTLETLANTLPQSINALKLVKGMGKKKSLKFGEELVNIIVAYCREEKIEPPAETLTAKKIPKKPKKNTRKESFDLYREGKSVPEIAEIRNLHVTTVEGHLAYYIGTGVIPATEFISKEKIDLIVPFFDGSDDLRLGPVKEILGDKVSWSELRIVMNHVKFLRSSQG
ncbi:MAG TPA: helix-turn-helix domain-containing protein [Bacteroidales bacterium]|nr:helix-turn-helix domain-containing protein [Bacteroidales bacterium]